MEILTTFESSFLEYAVLEWRSGEESSRGPEWASTFPDSSGGSNMAKLTVCCTTTFMTFNVDGYLYLDAASIPSGCGKQALHQWGREPYKLTVLNIEKFDQLRNPHGDRNDLTERPCWWCVEGTDVDIEKVKLTGKAHGPGNDENKGTNEVCCTDSRKVLMPGHLLNRATNSPQFRRSRPRVEAFLDYAKV